MKDKIWAIVPAAGIGKRMSVALPKQYLAIADKPILYHTLSTLCAVSVIDGVVVGIRSDDTHWDAMGFDSEKLMGVCTGGEERVNTVLNAIDFLLEQGMAKPEDWALVHDAVRPCVSEEDIGELVNVARASPHGALLAAKVVDTLKQSDAQHMSVGSVGREGVWRALTPQMFPIGRLRSALMSSIESGVSATDESCAMELAGWYPKLVEGDTSNIKITVNSDMQLAEFFLKQRFSEYQR